MVEVNADFSGSTVVVVGGTSGINLGVAERFAETGARVAVMSRSTDKVDAAVSRLQSLGAEATGEAADVRDAEAVSAALQRVHGAFGDIDVLVSGAAGNFPAAAMGMSPNAFRTVIDIDLLGTYHVMRAAYPLLHKPGAVVINVSAPQAYIPMQMQSHVCAAKAGIEMLTRVLALEWGGDGVRVNAVVPGPIEGTEGMARLAPTPEARDIVTAAVPSGRWGTVQDIGDVCLFLASPWGSYVNGVILPADGGFSISDAGAAMTEILTRAVQGSGG